MRFRMTYRDCVWDRQSRLQRYEIRPKYNRANKLSDKRYQKFGVRNYRIREGLDSDTKSVIKIELQRSKTPTQRHVGRTRRCESWTDSRSYATRSLKHVRLWGSPVDNVQAHSFHSSMPFQYADKQPQDAAASPRRCRPSTVPYNS